MLRYTASGLRFAGHYRGLLGLLQKPLPQSARSHVPKRPYTAQEHDAKHLRDKRVYEPPRVCGRLQLLSRMERHEPNNEQILT